MGLFDDLLGKASELTGMGQDAADAASQLKDDAAAQVEEQVTNATEQLPQDQTEVVDTILGNENKE